MSPFSFLFFHPGLCLQGYFCHGGAMEPAPHSSENFPRNGPCPVGHYCPAGCLSPIPCPLGSIRNSTGTSVMFAHVMKRHFHAAGFEFKRDPLLISCCLLPIISFTISSDCYLLCTHHRRCVHGELFFLSCWPLLLYRRSG